MICALPHTSPSRMARSIRESTAPPSERPHRNSRGHRRGDRRHAQATADDPDVAQHNLPLKAGNRGCLVSSNTPAEAASRRCRTRPNPALVGGHALDVLPAEGLRRDAGLQRRPFRLCCSALLLLRRQLRAALRHLPLQRRLVRLWSGSSSRQADGPASILVSLAMPCNTHRQPHRLASLTSRPVRDQSWGRPRQAAHQPMCPEAKSIPMCPGRCCVSTCPGAVSGFWTGQRLNKRMQCASSAAQTQRAVSGFLLTCRFSSSVWNLPRSYACSSRRAVASTSGDASPANASTAAWSRSLSCALMLT